MSLLNIHFISWGKVVALRITDEPKTLSYTKTPILTTSMSRLVPSLYLSKLYPWGTRQWNSWSCPPSRSSPLVTWWPVTHLHPSKLSHTFVVLTPLPSLSNPKSLSPVNFSASQFKPMVLDYRLISAPRWAQIVVNSLKITPIKYLMCGVK